MEILIEHAGTFRLSLFIGLVVVFGCAERLWPRRHLVAKRGQRWVTNFGLLVTGAIVIRVVVPASAIGAAMYADQMQIGVVHWLNIPDGLSLLFALLCLDLGIYAQHVAMHHVPVLWRLHRVHHLDIDLDVSSGLRFHPIEILLSILYKMGLVVLLGAPVGAVILFEAILNGMAIFNHSNTALPKPLERILRCFVVTPDLHRIHHSIEPRETNSNFGFSIVWWDRFFGTYTAEPRGSHNVLPLGLDAESAKASLSLSDLMVEPLKSRHL